MMEAVDSRSGVSGNRKLGMWLFLVSDSFTFAALLIATIYLRWGSANWLRPFSWSNIAYAFAMTLVLGASSVTMMKAVRAEQSQGRSSSRKWMLVTSLLGIVFLALHAIEWRRLFHEGITPWGSGGFGSSFFGVTGLHMLHVLAGVVVLGLLAAVRRFASEDVEVGGLYWQFVDVVWIFVFVLVYVFSIG
jgi:cytochrome c oxidase subunit 3